MNETIAAKNTQENISWICELENDGTVIHSSFRSPDASAAESFSGMVGHNFFDTTAAFDDISAAQQEFKSFVRSQKAADHRTWKCSLGTSGFDAKVSMTRAFQTGNFTSNAMIMLEIRSY